MIKTGKVQDFHEVPPRRGHAGGLRKVLHELVTKGQGILSSVDTGSIASAIEPRREQGWRTEVDQIT